MASIISEFEKRKIFFRLFFKPFGLKNRFKIVSRYKDLSETQTVAGHYYQLDLSLIDQADCEQLCCKSTKEKNNVLHWLIKECAAAHILLDKQMLEFPGLSTEKSVPTLMPTRDIFDAIMQKASKLSKDMGKNPYSLCVQLLTDQNDDGDTFLHLCMKQYRYSRWENFSLKYFFLRESSFLPKIIKKFSPEDKLRIATTQNKEEKNIFHVMAEKVHLNWMNWERAFSYLGEDAFNAGMLQIDKTGMTPLHLLLCKKSIALRLIEKLKPDTLRVLLNTQTRSGQSLQKYLKDKKREYIYDVITEKLKNKIKKDEGIKQGENSSVSQAIAQSKLELQIEGQRHTDDPSCSPDKNQKVIKEVTKKSNSSSVLFKIVEYLELRDKETLTRLFGYSQEDYNKRFVAFKDMLSALEKGHLLPPDPKFCNHNKKGLTFFGGGSQRFYGLSRQVFNLVVTMEPEERKAFVQEFLLLLEENNKDFYASLWGKVEEGADEESTVVVPQVTSN